MATTQADKGEKERNLTISDKLHVSTMEGFDSPGRASEKPDKQNKTRDEFSYTANMLSTDPSKRFLIEGEQDGRIIKDIVRSNEKPTYFPKRIDEVDSSKIDYSRTQNND